MSWKERLDVISTSVLSDVLDSIGYGDQVMAPEIKPLFNGASVAGYAFTRKFVQSAEPNYQEVLRAFDTMGPAHVIVSDTNGCREAAVWGELLTITALKMRVNGHVVDGAVRDAAEISELGFPVFSTHSIPRSSRGHLKLDGVNVDVVCGGIAVHPGDFIFGDHDGVVVIPGLVVDEVIEKAVEKAAKEKSIIEAINTGITPLDAFKRFGLL